MERPDRAAGRFARHLASRLPGPYLSAVMSGTAHAKHFAPPEAATSGPRNLAGLGRAALEAEVCALGEPGFATSNSSGDTHGSTKIDSVSVSNPVSTRRTLIKRA